ncbi:serine/threonine protein kinase [bacterium]|nr:serine/threonine protein kinase [bacterium]
MSNAEVDATKIEHGPAQSLGTTALNAADAAATPAAPACATPLPERPALPEGARLGPYRVVRHVGRGGMGDVYLAHDENLDRRVALKTIVRGLAEDLEFARRFRSEAQAAARVDHPNLVHVYFSGEEQSTLFFAMEFVEGASLGDHMRKNGKLPWPDAVRYAIQAAQGLCAAQAQGVIHRDVKPENLLLSEDGTVKVADFGLAKRVQDAGHTASGVIVGTPRYMSPEQAQGEPLDARADIYSLGATLFHLVAGRPVFDGSSAMKVCMRHITEAPPELAIAAPGVPSALSRTVSRMLAKRRDDRHATYAELIAELQAIVSLAATTSTERMASPGIANTAAGSGRTPGRQLVNLVKRPDGGMSVEVACPLENQVSEPVRAARARAPLASRARWFAATAFDLGHALMISGIVALIPWPAPPAGFFHHVVFMILLGLGMTLWLVHKGGTFGERLFDVRLVSKTGKIPPNVAIILGWDLAIGLPIVIFMCFVGRKEVLLLLDNNEHRMMGPLAGFAVASVIEWGTAIVTGRSLRDHIFKTRVVDIRGLPEEEDE